MSGMDKNHFQRYLYAIIRMVTVSDVLEKLKADLATEEATAQRAATAAKQLRVAIAAIERDIAATGREDSKRQPRNRRGAISRAILDCIRDGVGTVGSIRNRLAERGINTSGPSISNAIQRMLDKRSIAYSSKDEKYIIVELETATPEKQTAPTMGL